MKHRTRYKQAGLLAIVLIAVLLTTVFVRFRLQTDPEEQTEKASTSEAALTINGFEHTATRDGKTEWVLNAATAEVYSDQNRAVLSDIEMTAFDADGTEVKLFADTGELDTKTRDMTVEKSVVARYPGYELRTESLHYKHELHILYTDQKVVIHGENMQISGDSATVELQKNQVTLEGHIKSWMDPVE